MIKILNPSVVKIVGSIASVLLRHLKYWKDSSGKEVVYRTNTQLVDDLEGMFSASQIQRAKKKLIENGLIEITYGKGHDRTTHYSLTKKALELLDSSKTSSEANSNKKDGKGSGVPHTSKTSQQRAKTGIKKGAVAHSYGNVKSMQECFEEGSDNKNADRSLTLSERLALIKGEKIDLNKHNEALEQYLDESGTNVPDNIKNVSMELTDSLNEMFNVNKEDEHLNALSQQDYDECDLAMLNALNNKQEHSTSNKLTCGKLFSSVYKSGVSEARERIYRMTQLQSVYLEDY
ncbi:Uncharacterised protein [Acinetobacter phage MD-2021a]|nr:Uncharacterised protein [Acinetobacter phage MD-2021a]CAH1088840.1 Uncharacterised protein [Acinetobacter phage MD-2021a]